MIHIRDKHNTRYTNQEYKGEHIKKSLRNISYYHGYKGYRFIKNKNNLINFNNFNEIVELNKFDMELKSLIYPKIMVLETAIKNHVLESIFQYTRKTDFESIYSEILTSYNEIQRSDYRNSNAYNNAYRKKVK